MITAKFIGGDFCINVFGLVQWDVGQKLKIEGLAFSKGAEVHFSNAKTQTAIRKPIFEGGICEIPDALLEDGLDIIAWVYCDDETIREIILPIEQRKKPDGFVTDKEAKAELEATVQEVKDANAIGVTNLAEHGIELDETATTHDIVSNIAYIPALKYATTVASLFAVGGFPLNTELIIDIPKCSDINNIFKTNLNLKKVKLSGNEVESLAILDSAFMGCTTLEEIDFSGFCLKVQSCVSTFTRCGRLKRILGEFDFSDTNALTTTFMNTASLEEIRIKKETVFVNISFPQSSKLSTESLQSIIDGLATVEEQRTLKLNALILSVLTEEQMTQILNKNWMVM